MTNDRRLVTKSEDLPPLTLSPSGVQQVQRLANDSGEVAGVEMALELLSAHTDPLVRVAVGKLKTAVTEWAQTKASASKIGGGACDHYDLVLPGSPRAGDRLIIGSKSYTDIQIEVDPAIDDRHVVVQFADDQWHACSESNRNPNRHNRWLLNGELIKPHEPQPINVGDEIQIGHSIVHVRAAE